jgi:GT2 family glycosyltransferase
VTVSVVIATLGRPEPLRRTLAALAACEPRPDEVIVVDGDAGRSAEGVAAEAPLAVSYLTSEPGSTLQRNVGIDAASGEVIVFCDDDVLPDSHVFAKLADAYLDPAVVGATTKLLEPADRSVGGMRSPLRRLLFHGREGTFTAFGYPRYVTRVDLPHDVEVMPGCFMSARADLARHVRFDEEMRGYALAEDEDFSYRLSRLGRIVYRPDATVVHDKQGFARRDERAFGRLVVRNRWYLFRKNFRPTLRTRTQFVLLVVVMLAHRVVNRDLAGARGLVEGAAEAWLRP